MASADPNFSVAGFSLKKDDAAYRREAALAQLEKRRNAQNERQQTLQLHKDQTAMKIASVNFDHWEHQKERRVKDAFDRIIEKEWYDKYEGNLKLAEQTHINAVREHFAMKRDKIKTPAPAANYGLGGIGSRVGGDVANPSTSAAVTMSQRSAAINTTNPNVSYPTPTPHYHGINDSAHNRHPGGIPSISVRTTRYGGNNSLHPAIAPAAHRPIAAAAEPVHGRKSTNNTITAAEWADNMHAMEQLGNEGNFVLHDRFMKMVQKKSEARKQAEAARVFAMEAAAAQNTPNYSLFPRRQ